MHRPRESVRDSSGEYVNGPVHTEGIESTWAMLKRSYHGTYRPMSTKHLSRYRTKFAGRRNARSLNTINQLRLLVRGMVGKRLRGEDLIG